MPGKIPVNVDDKLPVESGWYATLHAWDAEEGFFPGAHYWTGSEWRENQSDTQPIIGTILPWLTRFRSKVEAESYASENDPEW
jgi:hypothetical protein